MCMIFQYGYERFLADGSRIFVLYNKIVKIDELVSNLLASVLTYNQVQPDKLIIDVSLMSLQSSVTRF